MPTNRPTSPYYRCNCGCVLKTLEEIEAIIDRIPKQCSKDDFISRLKIVIYYKKNVVQKLANVHAFSCSCSGGWVLKAFKEVEAIMDLIPKDYPKDRFISRLKIAMSCEKSLAQNTA